LQTSQSTSFSYKTAPAPTVESNQP
jgi:hypothetical protein